MIRVLTRVSKFVALLWSSGVDESFHICCAFVEFGVYDSGWKALGWMGLASFAAASLIFLLGFAALNPCAFVFP